jgi:hypothetical protein
LGSAEPLGKALRYNINQIAVRLSEAYPEELRILGGGKFPPDTPLILVKVNWIEVLPVRREREEKDNKRRPQDGRETRKAP